MILLGVRAEVRIRVKSEVARAQEQSQGCQPCAQSLSKGLLVQNNYC